MKLKVTKGEAFLLLNLAIPSDCVTNPIKYLTYKRPLRKAVQVELEARDKILKEMNEEIKEAQELMKDKKNKDLDPLVAIQEIHSDKLRRLGEEMDKEEVEVVFDVEAFTSAKTDITNNANKIFVQKTEEGKEMFNEVLAEKVIELLDKAVK